MYIYIYNAQRAGGYKIEEAERKKPLHVFSIKTVKLRALFLVYIIIQVRSPLSLARTSQWTRPAFVIDGSGSITEYTLFFFYIIPKAWQTKQKVHVCLSSYANVSENHRRVSSLRACSSLKIRSNSKKIKKKSCRYWCDIYIYITNGNAESMFLSSHPYQFQLRIFWRWKKKLLHYFKSK